MIYLYSHSVLDYPSVEKEKHTESQKNIKHADKVITHVPQGNRRTPYRTDEMPVKILLMFHSSFVLKAKLRNLKTK